MTRDDPNAEVRAMQERLLRMAVDIVATAQPKWLLHADGRIELVDDGLAPGASEALVAIETMLAQLQHAVERVVDGLGADPPR